MARAVAELARAQGIEVIHLSDRFARSTPDIEWIQQLRDEGWIIISGDPRISRNPAEREAWHESGMTAFFLDNGWANKKFWVQAAEIVRWFPIIVETAKECSVGAGFILPFQGKEPKIVYRP